MSARAVGGSRCAVGSSSRRTGAGEEGAREHQTLALPAGEHRPLLPHLRVHALGERRDPLREPRTLERGPQLGLLGRRAREAQVLADGGVEQVGVLAGQGKGRADILLAVLP